jgi:hypothetical protein
MSRRIGARRRGVVHVKDRDLDGHAGLVDIRAIRSAPAQIERRPPECLEEIGPA